MERRGEELAASGRAARARRAEIRAMGEERLRALLADQTLEPALALEAAKLALAREPERANGRAAA